MAIKGHDQDRIARIRERTQALIYLERAGASIAESAAFDMALERAIDVVQRELHDLTKSTSSIEPEQTRYSARPTMLSNQLPDYVDYDQFFDHMKRNKP